MNIKHDPILNVAAVEKHYTEQDGVPVKYVCTSELKTSNVPMDIFYRGTPHPTFGNRYFGVFISSDGHIKITNADSIEDTEFAMINVDGEWHYSSYRHHFKSFTDSNGDWFAIDGGRGYARGAGYDFFKVRDGKIIDERHS